MAHSTLASLTTLRLGGPVERLLTISDPVAWPEAVRAVGQRDEAAPVVVLGHGSNVIAADAGHPGTVLVMNTRGITATRVDRERVAVTVQAGHPLTDLVAWAAAEHLAGIECLAGIPGTTGAAPVQNAGAYGEQVSDTLDHVTAWDWDKGRLRTLPAEACRLRHRDSRFKAEPGRWTVLTATFHLTRSSAAPVTYQPLADELGVRVGARPRWRRWPQPSSPTGTAADCFSTAMAPTPARSARSSSTRRSPPPRPSAGRPTAARSTPTATDNSGPARAGCWNTWAACPVTKSLRVCAARIVGRSPSPSTAKPPPQASATRSLRSASASGRTPVLSSGLSR